MGEGVLPDGQTFAWEVVHGNGYVEAASWHPRFGSSVASSCLVIELDGGRSQLKLSWL